MKFLSQLKKGDLNGKTVLLRVDLNIENEFLKQAGSNLRIVSILPTIKFLIKNGARVVLLSHRGRPELRHGEGDMRQVLKDFSLEPFVKILEKLLKKKVGFVDFERFDSCFRRNDSSIFEMISKSKSGSLFLLENLRFFEGEDKNDIKFAKQLSKIGDIYVNEAFAFSHRKTASMVGVTKFLPSYCGILLAKEIENLNSVMKGSKKPLVIILGGAKISDKIGLIKNFFNKADLFLTGGGIANTLFKANNIPIGDSICEKEIDKFTLKISTSKKLILPIDVKIQDKKILDIGEETEKEYSEKIKSAKIIIWNGPMGFIEDKRFLKGSDAIATAILKSKAFVVVGGGETATLFSGKKIPKNVFISTGGGAMLEYLAGITLPGIKALSKKSS